MKHKDHLEKTGYLKLKRKDNLNKKIKGLIHNKLEVEFWDRKKLDLLDGKIDNILIKKEDPYSFVEEITGIKN
ncbi:MAG: hypothetical protein R2942_02570 [Ignavibacteria bacterium]